MRDGSGETQVKRKMLPEADHAVFAVLCISDLFLPFLDLNVFGFLFVLIFAFAFVFVFVNTLCSDYF